jgi:hypothetical protein
MIPGLVSMILPFFKEWFSNPFSKDNLSKTLLLVVGILLLFSFRSCNKNADLKAELASQEIIANNNYDALTGKIKVMTTKNGELEYSKTILYADKESLKKLNAELSEELEKEKGNVKVITKIKTQITYVPVTIPNTVIDYGNGCYGLSFKSTYRDSGLVSELEGISAFNLTDKNVVNPDSTTISKNSLSVDIVYGVRELDDKIEVFARSKSPLVKFNEMQGAYIMDKKPEQKAAKWFLGPQIGYNYNWPAGRSNIQILANLQRRVGKFTFGMQTGIVRGLETQQTDLRLGLRFQYNLFQW